MIDTLVFPKRWQMKFSFLFGVWRGREIMGSQIFIYMMCLIYLFLFYLFKLRYIIKLQVYMTVITILKGSRLHPLSCSVLAAAFIHKSLYLSRPFPIIAPTTGNHSLVPCVCEPASFWYSLVSCIFQIPCVISYSICLSLSYFTKHDTL